MKELSEAEMLHRAAAYCSGAERCISDVEKKIIDAGFDQEICKRIIARLVNEKFIDERRFARFFVNDKFRFNKWGKVKINYELQKKKIPSEIRSEAIENIDDKEYYEMIYDLIKAKMKTIKSKNNADLKMKLYRFAAGRGFEMRDITKILNRITDSSDDDYEYMD